MFENKLNYITAAMALGLLLLLGRFSYMQVVAYDHYAGQAESMRTGMTLLEPQRADIRLKGGQIISHTESVWDVYLDLEKFADPRTLAQRAHLNPGKYDPEQVKAFTSGKLQPVLGAALANPSSRRRFFMLRALRNEEICRQDFEHCAASLCLITGVTREEFSLSISQVNAEVDALAAGVGDPAKAPERAVNKAWLRAKPALTDPEYWARIIRFPKSLHFEPVLAARLRWQEKQAETLQGMVDAADGDAALLRELCFQAMRTCRDKADALNLDVESSNLSVAQAQDVVLEEHAAWLRLADVCGRVVRGDTPAVQRRLDELEPAIRSSRERLERLRKDVIEAWAEDWKARWSGYTLEQSPLLLLRDAPRDVVELLKVNADRLPGVVAVRRAARHFEYARELAHVLGGVGLPDFDGVQEIGARASFGQGLEEMIDGWFEGDREKFRRHFTGSLSRQLIGVSGVELAYDERLGGLYGGRVMAHDAAGRNRGIEFEKAPENAGPLTLTIDIELQRDIMRNVAEWEQKIAGNLAVSLEKKGQAVQERWQKYQWTMRGAAVVLDVKTGEILALCSFPDYDPRALAGRSEADREYQRQFKAEIEHERATDMPWWNQRARMFNRARDGLYAPGSTFKVITAAALLESGTITPGSTMDEPFGAYEVKRNGKLLGKTRHPAGNDIHVRYAIEQSSNGFFYWFTQDLGESPQQAWEVLKTYAEFFGVGRHMGTDLGHARQGRLPEPDRVWAQNLAMLAIGQGEMVMTPLELARAYAAIANRGTLVVPHVAEEARAEPEILDFKPGTWDIIHEGMRDVVARGTAKGNASLRRIKCAGKTGTSENGAGVPDHAWFAGFAPHDDPQVAFVMLAANSDLKGGAMAPVIGECIERYFERTGVIAKRE